MPGGETQRRAEALARVAHRMARVRGVALPDDLRLWDLARTGQPAPLDANAVRAGGRRGGAASRLPSRPDDGDLAEALESVTAPDDRRSRGLHVTPRWLAEELVGRALPPSQRRASEVVATVSVCDPACGGGAFLLATARLLHRRGMSRVAIVRHCLWGADVDPVGLAAAEASLALWAGEAPPVGRLVVADALGEHPALWPDRPADGFDLVVGNPPFLSQLADVTARSHAARRRLRARFGDAVRPYTDTAWLFLLLGCELARPRGRVVLVQPQSLVAARDAAAVRGAVDRRASLVELWVEDRRVFAANVRVCAPILEVKPAGVRLAELVADDDQGEWADRLADAFGVPPMPPFHDGDHKLGDIADAFAGFRDEYYGLVPAVRDAAEGDLDAGPDKAARGVAPLVTAGAIDWAHCAWGERPTRFGRRSWRAPIVDLATVRGGAHDGQPHRPRRAAARWVERTLRPKVLVATQTRVIEAAVDQDGTWVASVPVIAVLPHRTEDLWRIASALASPSATVWAWRRSPGTALARDALKISVRDLGDLPLPVDASAWDGAAQALRDYASRPHRQAFEAFVVASAASYEAPESLVAWWRQRVCSVL